MEITEYKYEGLPIQNQKRPRQSQPPQRSFPAASHKIIDGSGLASSASAVALEYIQLGRRPEIFDEGGGDADETKPQLVLKLRLVPRSLRSRWSRKLITCLFHGWCLVRRVLS